MEREKFDEKNQSQYVDAPCQFPRQPFRLKDPRDAKLTSKLQYLETVRDAIQEFHSKAILLFCSRLH